MAEELTTTPASATAIDPADVGPIVTAIKSGWKTSEMWITVAVVGGAMVMAAYTDSPIVKAIGLGVAALKAGIYTWSRTQVKS